jgi:hypothetical protein
MLLPKLFLASRASLVEHTSGLDSINDCLNKKHYRSYPHNVIYQFNSRGFRDREWPEDVKSAIWCVGDSFTVGIGSPLNHTWAQQVELTSGQRTVNVGMDGASNDWIARQACDIIQTVHPRNMIIMWSYVHRREDPDTKLSDEDRRIGSLNGATELEDQTNFQTCISSIEQSNTNIVHFIIPFAYAAAHNTSTAKDWLPDYIKEVLQLDFARDGHHFDILTSQWVAQQAASELIL